MQSAPVQTTLPDASASVVQHPRWRAGIVLLSVMLITALLLALGVRIFGPVDITRTSQPSTISYTVHMLETGRFALPVAPEGEPARKPPLYNWIALPFVMLMGPDSELAHKAPSIFSMFATLALCVSMSRRLAERAGCGEEPDVMEDPRIDPRVYGLVAGLLLISAFAPMRLMYLARPDTLMIACLIGGWAIATRILTDAATPSRVAVAVFWLCVVGAALCKGPPALLLPLYALVAAKPLSGQWQTLRRFQWQWGFPLALALVALWLAAAFRHNRGHVRYILLGQEIVERLIEGEPMHRDKDRWLWFTTLWQLPYWFVTRYLPWSLVAAVALLWVRPKRWLKHPLAPAIMWFVLVMLFFSLSAGKRRDYLGPIYPVAAILAAHALVTWLGQRRAPLIGAAAIIALLCTGGYYWYLSPESQDPSGRNIKAFVAQVQKTVGDEPILFCDVGPHPTAALLGLVPSEEPDSESLQQARWMIDAIANRPHDVPVIISDEIERVNGVGENLTGRLGLYRLYPPQPDRVISPATAG